MGIVESQKIYVTKKEELWDLKLVYFIDSYHL